MQTRIPAWFPLWCIAIFAMSAIAVGRLTAAEPGLAKPSAEPAKGILKIEGTGIERLTLQNRQSERELASPTVLHRPGSSVSLPVGEYAIQQIMLKSGYCSSISSEIFVMPDGSLSKDGKWLTISLNKPCVFKAGAPLTQKLTVSRQGRIIHLGYMVLDASSNDYICEKRDNPPRFTVFCNGQEVGSGTFEYG